MIPNLHPVRDLAALYPQHFQRRALVSGATIVEGRSGLHIRDLHDEWDYATDADELIDLDYELGLRRAELIQLKRASRDCLAAGRLGLAILDTRDALIVRTRIRELERQRAALIERVSGRVAA